MKIIISTSNNVFSNLAFEDYLITNSVEDYLLFYRNRDSVVIGKHQNPWKEVDLSIQENGNQHMVARRLSGGGTVYHDLGNINFSFIKNKDKDFVNFKEHINPISATLQSMGIKNEISHRNDIFIQNHKVSGNAEHVNSKLKRILHHGTLLYDSDLIRLNGSIRPKIDLLIDTHAVDSVRSPVMNIRDVADLGTTDQFLDSFIHKLKSQIKITHVESINPEDILKVQEIVKTKNITWEWNFGHTPQFTFTNSQGEIYKIRKGFIIESNNKKHIGKRFDFILND